MHSLGYGDDLNRDVLEDQHEEYELALPQVAQWLETEIIQPLIETQWLLYGIYSQALEYEVTWKREEMGEAQLEQQQVEVSLRKAEAVSKAAEAGQKLAALGWNDATIAKVIGSILADVEIDIKPALRQDASSRLATVQTESLLNGNGHKQPLAERQW